MFISGTFYGTISVAQAYAEALSQFLCDKQLVPASRKDNATSAKSRWIKLCQEKIVTEASRDAAHETLSFSRNHFHHLNDAVEQDHAKLEATAEQCVNHIFTIESDVFAYTYSSGAIVPRTPEYWPSADEGLINVRLRQPC